MPSNWIDDVLEECSHVETPRSWLWWSLCTAISASAGSNYFLKTLKGAVVFKPNLYVILLGDSGLGKEFPIQLAIELVTRANVTRVISGRSSIQAIVKELATARTREGRAPMLDSRGFIVNGEISTAIIQDPDSLTILTDLYDNKSTWTNLLKGDGKEVLKNPCITTLFGSSPAHFYDSVPQVNIEGGYVGRNLIAYEEKRAKDTDLLDDSEGSDVTWELYSKFVPHLEKINGSSGRIIPDNESKVTFNDWRRKWRQNQPKDTTGFVNRVPGHILKVAMCLCLSRYDSGLVINPLDIEEAIERVTALVYSNKRATEGKSSIDPLAIVLKKILDLLIEAPEHLLKRKIILNRMYTLGIADMIVVDKALDNLMENGWLNRERFVAGSATDWVYRLTGQPLEQYKKFIAGLAGRVK